MKTSTRYSCEICGSGFDTADAAQACEAQGVDAPVVGVGDIVFLRAGYGWYDGDPAWVSNPGVKPWSRKNKCPNGYSNCFSECCTYRFYYVVTAIDTADKHYESPGHRTRYHVETLAMTGKQGHRGPGYTFNEDHIKPVLVLDPPPEVVEQGRALIGHRAKFLF